MNARAMRTSVAMITAAAPRKTAAAALIRDQPRSRSARTNGANVAAMMPATRIDAVTSDSRSAIQMTTTIRAIAARIRQPIAARRLSQPGTSSGAGGSAVAESVIGCELLRTVRRDAALEES